LGLLVLRATLQVGTIIESIVNMGSLLMSGVPATPT